MVSHRFLTFHLVVHRRPPAGFTTPSDADCLAFLTSFRLEALAASRAKMAMWTAKSSGTMKPGIKSHGSVVMMAVLGS
jgi:hypothetical protein